MQLYHHPFSPNAKRARVAAAELGIQLDLVLVDVMKGENKQSAYLERNPMGKVPTLVDGEYTLWESPGILTYLAQKHGKLMPKDPRGVAETVRWLCWNASHLEPGLFRVGFERVLKPMMGAPVDQSNIDSGLKDIERYAPILDHQLAGRDWVIGELSIVDITIATSIEFAIVAKVDFSPYKNITSWFERIRSRPSWQS